MLPPPSQRDMLLCALAREQQLLDDAELEAAVRHWRTGPPRALWDVLTFHARLSPAQTARLALALDQQSADASGNDVAPRLQSLPPAVRRLLGQLQSDVVLAAPTQRGFETRPMDSKSPDGAASRHVPLTPGERFDVLQVHAQGGLGVVFLARDQEIDRTVALKQIKPHWADDEDSRARFLLEARITGRLEHPGIVPIYALGADATGRPYYAMRLIRGECLLDVIERFHNGREAEAHPSRRMPELRKLLQRFLDVCNAVDYAHSKGVIHRDVKPSNIMVGKFGETLVVDWGLAKVIGSDEDVALTTQMIAAPGAEGGATSTRMGTAIGTPAYMSPEQAAGRNNELGPATDVYSLGATLYHLLTGWLPHVDDEDVGVMIAKVGTNKVVPVRERAPWLPKPLAAICTKALAPSPEARYASARALAEDIERWLADEPVRAHADSWVDRAFRWMRNHRTLATSLAVAYLVATVAIVVGVILWNHIQSQQRKMDQQQSQVAR